MNGYRNEIRLSGNVVHKYYMEGRKRLLLTLSVIKPEVRRATQREGGEMPVRDRVNFPTIVVTGDLAESLNRKIDPRQRFQFIETICHAASESMMRYTGGGNYHRENRLVFFLDELLHTERFVNVNDGYIRGKVIRSWHSEDPSKRFYIVDVECGKDRFQVTCFDQEMILDPKEGEEITIFAEAQTARRETEAENGDKKTNYYMTIVARTVRIDRDGEDIAA